MSRRVLLVDSDVDALGTLASVLRAVGLIVSIASDADSAVELAFQFHPDIVIAGREIHRGGDVGYVFRARGQLAEIPVLYLLDEPHEDEVLPDEVRRMDTDQIINRITGIAPRFSRLPPPQQDIRGDLEQVPLVDMLQLLTMNRRTGTLSITAPDGNGEVRLADGQVVDATYRRLTGERALYRLLAGRRGRFAFGPGDAPVIRRIQASTNMLLMEAMRQVDEQNDRRMRLAPHGEVFVLTDQATKLGMFDAPESRRMPTTAPIRNRMLDYLHMPRSLDEVLDEVEAPDLDILDMLMELRKSGLVQTIALSTVTTQLAPPEQFQVLRSLVSRLERPGFAPPPRLVIAMTPQRLPMLAYSMRRITDVVASTELPARAPLPRLIGTLKLGEGVDVAIIGLPLDETYAPIWGMALPGSAAVVQVGDCPQTALKAHCEAVEVRIFEAERLVGSFDPTMPVQVAALLRAALEAAAGVE
jgi:CheY-like chemotaxis protein